MLLGYVIFSYDNKRRMYGNIKLGECEKYQDIYSINQFDPSFRIKTTKSISCTYDNFTIVKDDFKAFCESEKYHGLEFVLLPNAPGYYWFKVHNVIEFDAKAYGTRFINFNEKCNGYEEIIGATPARLKVNEAISDGFFRTDLCFGSYASKFPLIIVGVETIKKLKAAGFKGIAPIEIKDKYD